MSSPNPASFQIGVDGGGTHTRAIVLDTAGKVLGTGSAAGCNPNNIGFPQAAQNILDAIRATRVSLTESSSLCMGIAGLATAEQREKLRHHLTAALPELAKAKLHLTHDLDIAHFAAFRGKPGIVLIAGTGSACFARDKDGTTYRASGRDFPYDDPGSGYAIGKRAIDIRLLPAADSRPEIAALAPRVIELAAAGDLKALDILRIEAEQLAKLARLVYQDYAQTEPFPTLALAGSILTADSLYRYTARFELQSTLPGVKLVDVDTPPEKAAAAMAKQLA